MCSRRASCCSRPRRRRTPATRPRSRSPARSSRRPAARATGIRPARRRISPTTRATTSGRARSRCPPASYEYKAALNDAWDENYGLHAVLERREHPAQPRRRRERQVLLRPQDPLGDGQQELRDRGRAGQLPVRARLPRRLGPELPPLVAPGPRRRRHLHVRDDGAPAGSYETKVAINESLGRELRRRRRARAARNIAFSVPAANTKVTFSYVASTHVLTVDRAGREQRGRLALRPRAQGLPRHRAQHDVEGLVHGRGRRAQRRLLPDGRQHERRDAAVRRHRRLDVHRPAGARHDLHASRRSTTPAAWRARSRRRRRAASTRS